MNLALKTFSDHSRLAKVLLASGVGLGPAFDESLLKLHERFAALIKEGLDAAVAEGSIPPLDSTLASYAWMGALNEIILSDGCLRASRIHVGLGGAATSTNAPGQRRSAAGDFHTARRGNRLMAKTFQDLGEFIAFLEERGELRRITAPVSWDLEITEITQRVLREGGPALLFENVDGHTGTPVVINLFGTAQRMAWALNVENLNELPAKVEKVMQMAQGGPPSGIMNKLRLLGDLTQLARIGPRRVEREDAPAQEVILQGDDIDLFSLPILKTWPQDAGRYITLPLVITKDP